MNYLKNISALFLGLILLLSTSGVVLYKSFCKCSGQNYTSIMVKPETCETDFHQHHKHDNENNELACAEDECHHCASDTEHSDSCGCDSPKSILIKLVDKAVNEEVRFLKARTLQLTVIAHLALDEDFDRNDKASEQSFYTDPPPQIKSSTDFLIKIKKLKIPSLA